MRCPGQDPAWLANRSCTVRRPRSHPDAAFTLIELLIVMVILLVLTTMYWGAGSPSRKDRDKQACQNNLLKIYVAMEIYAVDQNGKFPVVPGAQSSEEALDVLVPRYTTDTSVFTCPGSGDAALPAGESFRSRKISYAYYMGRSRDDAQELLMSDRQIDATLKSSGEVFSSTGDPPGNNHGKSGGNVLFGDGRVEMTPPQLAFSAGSTQRIVLLNPKP